jgi:hypothetical protein
MPIKTGLPPFKTNYTTNVAMLKYDKLQQQQLAQPLNNYHIFNQHPFQTQRSLTAVQRNFRHLFPTNT